MNLQRAKTQKLRRNEQCRMNSTVLKVEQTREKHRKRMKKSRNTRNSWLFSQNEYADKRPLRGNNVREKEQPDTAQMTAKKTGELKPHLVPANRYRFSKDSKDTHRFR